MIGCIDSKRWKQALCVGALQLLLSAATLAQSSVFTPQGDGVSPALAFNVVTGAITDEVLDNAERVTRCKQLFRLPLGPISECRTAIVGSAAGAVLTAGAFQWWKRGFSNEFTRINEGGFGRETHTRGVDKLSHAYTFYIGTRLLNDALVWGGASKTEALVTSVVANAGTAYLIELFDGHSKKTYGFSREDLVADAVGILMGSAVVAYPDLDRKFAHRMRYVPKGAGGKANFIDSYEG